MKIPHEKVENGNGISILYLEFWSLFHSCYDYYLKLIYKLIWINIPMQH